MALLRAAVRYLCGLLVLAALLWLADRLDPLPDVQASSAQTILARDGTPLWRFADANGVWRYPVSVEQVSPLYIEALLAYEDRWFYRHPGINPLALARALWLNLRHGRIVSGGSTLSMQVARIIEPHSRSAPGKLRQVWRTLQLEWHFSKREILEIYLHRAPFGGTLEGVAAASWAYLGKSPASLTAAEAALLAVLPQAPSRLRPDRYPQRAQAARDKLLERVRQQDLWPQQMLDEAQEESIWLAARREPALAPLLARRLRQGHGSLIQSTLDAALQQRLEDLLLGWKNRLPPRVSAAILVADSRSLEVLAYLGSADLHDAQRAGHVDMVQAVRSPGSTLKPLLYGLALEDGLSPTTLPVVFQGRWPPARHSLIHSICRRCSYWSITAPDAFMRGWHRPASACSIRATACPAWH